MSAAKLNVPVGALAIQGTNQATAIGWVSPRSTLILNSILELPNPTPGPTPRPPIDPSFTAYLFEDTPTVGSAVILGTYRLNGDYYTTPPEDLEDLRIANVYRRIGATERTALVGYRQWQPTYDGFDNFQSEFYYDEEPFNGLGVGVYSIIIPRSVAIDDAVVDPPLYDEGANTWREAAAFTIMLDCGTRGDPPTGITGTGNNLAADGVTRCPTPFIEAVQSVVPIKETNPTNRMAEVLNNPLEQHWRVQLFDENTGTFTSAGYDIMIALWNDEDTIKAMFNFNEGIVVRTVPENAQMCGDGTRDCIAQRTGNILLDEDTTCLLYTSPSPRD